jgi:hypothetical protein
MMIVLLADYKTKNRLRVGRCAGHLVSGIWLPQPPKLLSGLG